MGYFEGRLPLVPQRLAYYLQQRDQALKQAEDEIFDKEGWLRIAREWQQLHDALAAQLGDTPPDQHVLES